MGFALNSYQLFIYPEFPSIETGLNKPGAFCHAIVTTKKCNSEFLPLISVLF